MITLVDASVFMDTFGSDQDIKTKSELAFKPDDEEGKIMLEDMGMRKVTDLLLEQVECADVVLINKCDLLKSADDVALVKKVVLSVNPTAKVLTCVKGEVADPLEVVGSAGGQGAASWGILFEHKKMVEAAEKAAAVAAAAAPVAPAAAVKAEAEHSQHSHDHDHAQHSECAPDCNDPTHHHEHSDSHAHAHEKTDHSEAACAADCKDPSHNHDHSHEHNHVHTEACSAECTDPTHNHDHSHDHVHTEECAPECNDPTHNHDHSHSHAHSQTTTAEERFGITSFVYKRRLPFHPVRFSLFLQGLGKLSVKGIAEVSANLNQDNDSKRAQLTGNAAFASAKRSLLRSKGFVWMGTSKAAAYFMSHAGQYLELAVLGRWWADIDRAEWPAGSEEEITVDFQGPQGDRRQELVFIGQFGNDGGASRKALEEVLDSCLLTPEEMTNYEKISRKGDPALRALFFPE
jgi:G3E family GTPase